MARFSDYAKEVDDQLEDEIQEASDAQQKRRDIPESVLNRFKDKPLEDILESYANLERAYSQQGNKLGELRKSFDDYILLQSRNEPEPEPEPDPVSVDELYDDPETAISKVVERSTKDKLSKLEEELINVKRERALQDFKQRHPEAEKIAQSQEFIDWIKQSPYRMKLAQAADAFDLDAAEELFGLYEETVNTHEKKASRRRQVQSASLESSSPDVPKLDETFSRTEIIEHKRRAKLGDQKSRVWLAQNATAIAQAYEDGRVVD